MSVREFSLKPFPLPEAPPQLTITGSVRRRGGILSISYRLAGHLAEVVVPPPSDTPVRKDGLWKETCFEFFLARKGAEAYREFNLSPSGNWNVYHFDACRSGMRQETAFDALPFRVTVRPDSLSVDLEFELQRTMPQDHSPVELAISSVIKQKDGGVSFWALTHPGPQPDFHRRDSFLITL